MFTQYLGHIAQVVVELLCSSHLPHVLCGAALDRLLCTHLGSEVFLRHGFTPFINPTTLPHWWAPLRDG